MKIRQNGAAVQLADKKMTTLIPVKIKWHGGRKKVIPAATLRDQVPEHDASMLVALSRAYYWQRLIDAGVVDSGSDIARREGLHQTTVNGLLRLTQLSPALVRDILNGRQPKTLSMCWLKTNELPWDWDDQQEFFGKFDA
ncbi:MAG: site-specific recombinase resolvase [Propionivibrio sp.]|nr:site-specific recombinase resolvase [Propionivibrio sp.]